jgi:hypothetical protein
MEATEILTIVVLVIQVVGVGGIYGIVKISRESGKKAQDTESKIETLSKGFAELKKEIGNGGGLKADIRNLQLNCTGQMSGVKAALENHIRLPGHGIIPEEVADLKARVVNLEANERRR